MHYNQSINKLASLSGWLFVSILLTGADTLLAGQHDPKSPNVTRSGATIYHNYCSVCHGDKGDGQSRARNSFLVPPRNYTSPESAIELTRDRMIASVTHGRPGTAMIAWGSVLTNKEIEAVVDHVRATFMKLGNQSSARTRPSEKLLATRGGVLYMQACVMCHGDTGVRQISGSMQPPPRDFTSPAVIAELSRKRMIDSITNGRPNTAMRPYRDQYSQRDIAEIADFIRDAFMSANQQKN